MRLTGSKNHPLNPSPQGGGMYKILCQFCTARLTEKFTFLTGFSVTEKCDGCGRKYFLAVVKIDQPKKEEA
jgi:hypothetical protein